MLNEPNLPPQTFPPGGTGGTGGTSGTSPGQGGLGPVGPGTVGPRPVGPTQGATQCGYRNAEGVGFRITGNSDGESEYGQLST